jgi:hypothetical protein
MQDLSPAFDAYSGGCSRSTVVIVKAPLTHSAIVGLAALALMATGCGSSKSSTAMVGNASNSTITTNALGQDASQSNSNVPKCEAVDPAEISSQLVVQVGSPQGSIGSDGSEICDYKATVSGTPDVKITYTPNATPATVAKAKQDASDAGDDNVNVLTGIGDAGYQSQETSNNPDDITNMAAEKGGLMITVNSGAASAPTQTFLMSLFDQFKK